MGRADIAKLGIALYIVTFVFSVLMLATPGRYIPAYVVMCVAGVLPALADQRSIRLWAIPMVLFAAVLLMSDWRAGLSYRDARSIAEEYRIHHGSTTSMPSTSMRHPLADLPESNSPPKD